jgi:hypothetical protein
VAIVVVVVVVTTPTTDAHRRVTTHRAGLVIIGAAVFVMSHFIGAPERSGADGKHDRSLDDEVCENWLVGHTPLARDRHRVDLDRVID